MARLEDKAGHWGDGCTSLCTSLYGWPGPLHSNTDLLKERASRSSCHGSVFTNPTSVHEGVSSIPGLTHGLKEPALPRTVVYVGHRCGSDLTWL